jgi:hypothetical protein
MQIRIQNAEALTGRQIDELLTGPGDISLGVSGGHVKSTF